jgi:hypothetical protein
MRFYHFTDIRRDVEFSLAHDHFQSAFMPWICQGLVAKPGEPLPITEVPLSSQITACPVELARLLDRAGRQVSQP